MKLLIAGSRSITDFDISPYIPKGTKHTIDYANKIGKAIEIITVA